jgi:uncharacterized membrane protein
MASEIFRPGLSPRGDAVRAPPLTLLARAAILLGVEGASIGLLLGTVLVKGSLDAFLLSNTIGASGRRFMLALELAGAGVAIAAACVVALLHRRRQEMPSRLLHVGLRLAPLAVAGLVPLLLRWRAWEGHELSFLTLAGVAVLVFGAGLRAAMTAGPFAWEARLGGAARAVVEDFSARWPRAAARLPLAIVCVGALAYAVYFAYFTCLWHRGVRSGYDLALENNLVWNLVHGGRPLFKTSPAFGPTGTHLGHHMTLFAFVIAPLYALAPRSETLLTLQAALIGGAAVPLFLLARLRLGSWLACLIALLYLLYPPVHGANLYEFHYLPLGTLFLWTALYALETRRNWLAVVAVLLTLSIREDVAAGLAIFGLYLALSGRRPRAGAVVTVVAAVYFVAMKMFVMPHFAQAGETFTFIFARLLPRGENTFTSVLRTVITNPGFTVSTLIEPSKLIYVLHIFVPLAFIPLRRIWSVLFIVPGFMFTLLSTDYPAAVSIHYQYTAHWTTYLFVALVVVLADMDSLRRRAAVGAMVLGLLVCSHQFGSVLQRNNSWGGPLAYKFGMSAEDRRRQRAMEEIQRVLPPDAKVSASAFTVPQVSSREDDYSLTVGVFDAQYLLFTSEPGELMGIERPTVSDLLARGEFGVVAVHPPFALARRGHSTAGNSALLASWNARAASR